jgi:uncharacterized membrane-anchored protein
MSNLVKQVILFGVLFAVLGTELYMGHEKEMTLVTGQMMLLELAPRDPRSLMQGDYMVLRYKITQTLGRDPSAKDGTLVVTLDDDGVATFKRFHSPETPLAAGEHLLRYRKRGSGIRLGAESFFFQEGHANYYGSAKYGELRVSDSGDSILVGLRGKEREPLGPPLPASAP